MFAYHPRVHAHSRRKMATPDQSSSTPKYQSTRDNAATTQPAMPALT